MSFLTSDALWKLCKIAVATDKKSVESNRIFKLKSGGSLKIMPLAFITDGETLHRALLTRLVSCGFPLAWHSTDVKGEDIPRSIRARTPRHAVEIAAYLPPGGTTTRPEFVPTRLQPNPTSGKLQQPVIIIAVSGDAATDKSLGLLLSDGKVESSAYVDRSLLAGGILMMTGPLSEIAVSNASKRCKRAGMRLVMVATDGEPNGASGDALNIWCASEHTDAIEAVMPILHALAVNVKVIGRDPRNASGPRLAQTLTNSSLPETTEVMYISGTAAAAILAERRALRLAQELVKVRQYDKCLQTLECVVTAASEHALETDEWALKIAEENVKLHQLLERANSKNDGLAEVCAVLETQLGRTTAALQFAGRSRVQLEKTTAELRTKKLGEMQVIRGLTRTQQILKKEVRTRRMLHSKSKLVAHYLVSLHNHIIDKDAELCMRCRQVQAERRAKEQMRLTLDLERTSKCTRISELVSEIEGAHDVTRSMQTFVVEVADERDVAREEIGLIRKQYDMLQKLKECLECVAKNCHSAFVRTRSLENGRDRLESDLADANDAVLSARHENHKQLWEIVGIQNALNNASIKCEFETTTAVSRAECTATFALKVADLARIDTEARTRRLTEILASTRKHGERKATHVRELCTTIAATYAKMRNSFMLMKLLDAHVSITNKKVTRITDDVHQIKRIVQAIHKKRINTISAAKSALDHARSDTEAARRACATAEATNYRNFIELVQLRRQFHHANEKRTLAEDGEKIAQLNIAAERAAGAAVQVALIDLAAETARFSGEISTAQCLQRHISEGNLIDICTASTREECTVHAAIMFSNKQSVHPA